MDIMKSITNILSLAHLTKEIIAVKIKTKRVYLCKMTTYHHMERRTSEAYRIFFEALKLDNIDALVSAAWNFFNLPVLLTDENYKLICLYPKRKIGEDIWDTLYENSALPLDTVRAFQNEYLKNIRLHYKPFYADTGLVKQCPRIFGEVFTESRIVGHVAVFMFDQPLFPEDISCVQVFIDALKILMSPRRSAARSTLSSYLTDLLDSAASPQLRFLARRGLSASLSGDYSLMVTPVGESASGRAFAAMITSHIQSEYRSVVCAEYNGCIVTLFGLMSGGQYTQKEREFFCRISQKFSEAEAFCGLSEPFSDLAELQGRFQQAFVTARLTKEPLAVFHELFPDQIFDFLIRSAPPRMFIHPILGELWEYDRKKNTDYFNTLRVYSLSLHDKDASAVTLCIHRNTLLYRLNRIQELFHVPYDDPATALSILNSFQLWRVAGLGEEA